MSCFLGLRKAAMAGPGSGPPFVSQIFVSEFKKWTCNDGKVLDVCLEKVTQAHKGTNYFDISGQFGLFDDLKLVFPRLDTFLCQNASSETRKFLTLE
jgi:hypothetical protein